MHFRLKILAAAFVFASTAPAFATCGDEVAVRLESLFQAVDPWKIAEAVDTRDIANFKDKAESAAFYARALAPASADWPLPVTRPDLDTIAESKEKRFMPGLEGLNRVIESVVAYSSSPLHPHTFLLIRLQDTIAKLKSE